jgi:hypothetical protein
MGKMRFRTNVFCVFFVEPIVGADAQFTMMNRSGTQALIAEMKSGWWFPLVLWKNQSIFGMVPNDPTMLRVAMMFK